jgi:urease beta subunit
MVPSFVMLIIAEKYFKIGKHIFFIDPRSILSFQRDLKKNVTLNISASKILEVKTK